MALPIKPEVRERLRGPDGRDRALAVERSTRRVSRALNAMLLNRPEDNPAELVEEYLRAREQHQARIADCGQSLAELP